MKLLMRRGTVGSLSTACATRILEIEDVLLSHKLRMFGWWRSGNSTGFGLKYEHIINHYAHVYVWDGYELRDIRNEILEHHGVNTRRVFDGKHLSARDFRPSRRRDMVDGDSQTTGFAQ